MHQIHYYESGNGLPVVFIHGFCESNKIWNDLSSSLSKEFRVICPDLSGFGASPLPDENFSLEQIGDGLVSWLKNLGVVQCIVIGHSLGGYITLEILRKYPEFVKAVGLFNSSAFEDSAEKKENRNKLISFIEKNGVRLFLKTFVPSLFYPKTSEIHQKTIDQIIVDGLSINPESVINYTAAMRDRVDSIDLLKKYSDKILLISGEYDQNVPLNKSKEMAQYLEKENVHVILNSAHMSLFEQSNTCYNVVKDFVKKFE